MIKKILKKITWAVVIFAVLDICVVLALPHLLPMEKITGILKDKVREQTGRDLAFSDANFSFWPNIGVTLKDVTFSNPAWAQQKNMMVLGTADVALEVMPLLDRHIVVKKFILNAPAIYLETATDGRQSWDFSNGKAVAPAPAVAPQHKEASTSEKQDFDFRFDQVQISKGKLILIDQQKKTTTTVEDVDIDLKLPDLKSPMKLTGGLTYKAKRITLDLGIDRPLDFFNGRTSSGEISVKSDSFALKADGSFATQGTLLKGDIDASVPDIAGVVAWASNKPVQKMPFEKMSFKGDARLTKGEIILKQSALTLDDVKAVGDVDVEFTAKPVIFARLSLNKLNLDRFTGGGADAAAPGASGAKQDAAPAESAGWDTHPLDFSGLRMVNADLKLQTQGFSLKGTDVGPSALAVQVSEGNLHFTSSDATLAGGKFSSDMRLNAATATPTMAFAFNMSGVNAQPILATFAHFKKLSGAATAHVTLTSTGDNQKAIISNLMGNGDVDFKNGELQGIDFVKIAKLVQEHSTDVGVDDGSTKFVDLTGTFSIVKGIVSNTDMKLKGTVLQATGQGIVDLPNKNIQYKAIPVLMTSANAPPALSIPVKITGPFDHIKVYPDFASTVKSLLKDPSGAKALIKNLGGNLKQNNILQSILKGKSAQ